MAQKISKACLGTEEQLGCLQFPVQCPQLSQASASPPGTSQTPTTKPSPGWVVWLFWWWCPGSGAPVFLFHKEEEWFLGGEYRDLPYSWGEWVLTSFPLWFSKGAPAHAYLEFECKSGDACDLFSERCFMWLKLKTLCFFFFLFRLSSVIEVQAVISNWRQRKGHKLPYSIPTSRDVLNRI